MNFHVAANLVEILRHQTIVMSSCCPSVVWARKAASMEHDGNRQQKTKKNMVKDSDGQIWGKSRVKGQVIPGTKNTMYVLPCGSCPRTSNSGGGLAVLGCTRSRAPRKEGTSLVYLAVFCPATVRSDQDPSRCAFHRVARRKSTIGGEEKYQGASERKKKGKKKKNTAAEQSVDPDNGEAGAHHGISACSSK